MSADDSKVRDGQTIAVVHDRLSMMYNASASSLESSAIPMAIRLTVPRLTRRDLAELDGLMTQMDFYMPRMIVGACASPIGPFTSC